MKSPFRPLLAGFILSGLCFAQSTQPPATNPSSEPYTAHNPSATGASGQPANQQQGLRLAPGSVIPVQLTKTVDAKKLKTGDQVEAKVTQDLKSTTGELMVPKDTKVIGHVTEAQPRSKEQKESQVGIAFDHAVVKGSDVQLPMSIQAVISQSSLHPDQNNAASANNASSPGPGTQPGAAGRAPGAAMGGEQSAQPSPDTETTSGSEKSGKAAGPITAETKGVVGISNLTLSNGASAQGSVLSSDKNNVKLESGTLILLRVNQ